MSYSSAKRRRIKPLARPTSFDLNVSFDIRHYQNVKYGNVIAPYFPAIATNEAFHVMEGELIMKFKPGKGVTYRDHQMHTFSFANGLKSSADTRLQASKATRVSGGGRADNNTLVHADERFNILSDLQFAGVSVTGFKPETDVFEQGFVCTLGGLNTIFNNGKDTINAGDILAVDLPETVSANRKKRRALQTGIPNEKLQFIVRPLEKMIADYGELRTEKLAAYVIGTALSYSRAGQPVDIVLHRCNRWGFSIPRNRQQGDDLDDTASDADSVTAFGANLKKSKKSKKTRAKVAPTKTTNDA